jgi:integrase
VWALLMVAVSTGMRRGELLALRWVDQEILGHSSISITMDLYSHVLPSVQQEAAGKVDSVLRDSLRRAYLKHKTMRARKTS